MFAASSMVNPGLSSTYFCILLKSSLRISSALITAYFFYVCLWNSVFLICSGSEAHRLKKLTQSSFLLCAVNFLDVKFVMLALNNLLFFCWSTLGALAIESKDLFCDCEDDCDLVLVWSGGGGGGRWRWEFCFLGADCKVQMARGDGVNSLFKNLQAH
jgi:hypothetical protein